MNEASIVTATLLPIEELGSLRSHAIPRRSWEWAAAKETYHDYLDTKGKVLDSYRWPGDFLVTAVSFLNDKGIQLLETKHGELAEFLSEERDDTHFLFTNDQKKKYLEEINKGSFTDVELVAYYEDFFKTTDSDAAQAMREAIEYISMVLSKLNEKKFAVIEIE